MINSCNADVSLTPNSCEINFECKELARIDMPQGYCRPETPFEISFPLRSFQFGYVQG